MALNFEKYAAKGNEFLHILAEKLGDRDDTERAGRVLRSVLRALRNHLTTEESMQMMAQLPMALKGIYVDGWLPGSKHHPKVKNLGTFVQQVMLENGRASEKDFPDDDSAIAATRAFIETLALFVSQNELEEAFGTLPAALNATFASWLPAPKTL